jgi:hypothetical protein
VPATTTVPGALAVTATAGTVPGDVIGFVVLTRGADARRIPFWFAVSAPKLGGAQTLLVKPGVVRGTTKGAPSRVSAYRYPTGGDTTYNGPERSYRVQVTGAPANIGAVVLSGQVVPHVVLADAPDHLAGYAGLPTDLNPYRESFGKTVGVAGAVLPAAGSYTFVFDTRSAAGAGSFSFRWWVNDVMPPRLKAVPGRGAITVLATDAGSGVDPSSVVARLDGRSVTPAFNGSAFRVRAARGRHALVLTVSDHQEAKNMEDVARILPNTTTLHATVQVR